ncbi:serine/threonine-protein kinase [Paraliomyxa miuraensis]|uniref:serine/threonine-protein kinase n=1 Tax=Paraliomyxa miuraensis TaxID=376150 RepID=UPI00225B8DCC|nr:serine/threonine-protein kinase [Paraliomyxa miuraensis]MCX4242323.1 serine/threonine protein kinase [Paraliomyxa miuraensis]
MTAQWALALAGDVDDAPLHGVLDEVVARFSDGAARPDELPALARFADDLRARAPLPALEAQLRTLSHAGYLRGSLTVIAGALRSDPTPELALVLARELLDALDPSLGVRLCRAVLARPEVQASDRRLDGAFVAANLLLGDALLEGGDPGAALRHFEAVLSVDVDHPRALRGWGSSVRALEAKGLTAEHRSRGLALLDGLDELELRHAFGAERYDLGRPLGRGRHAVVYEAYDRHVGRDVAIKRLLQPDARRSEVPERVLEARFFAEARTLARVRSPHVVALYDVQPRHRFIALELCRGGNLRLALRRGLCTADDLPRIAEQLRAALAAVHAAGAVHRDIKPANILVRERRRGSPVALADFGLAVGHDPNRAATNAGTLRYLAPELRGTATLAGPGAPRSARATPASDRFSAGVVLLELAQSPMPLPDALDRIDADLDARALVPDTLPAPWPTTLRALLSPHPEERQW